eukprot:5213105-Amphidinium_carterae.1
MQIEKKHWLSLVERTWKHWKMSADGVNGSDAEPPLHGWKMPADGVNGSDAKLSFNFNHLVSALFVLSLLAQLGLLQLVQEGCLNVFANAVPRCCPYGMLVFICV